MNISCLIIATNIPSRLHLLDNSIMAVERANSQGLVNHKVLSIDWFTEFPQDSGLFRKYEELGWTVVTGACSGHRGMLNNILRGLSNMPLSDFILYVEDDIMLDRLPGPDGWEGIRDANLGFVCFNTHINGVEKPHNADKERFINDSGNYKRLGGDLFLVKQPVPLRDEYYLNFPSSIIKDDVFRALLDYAARNCSGIGLEPGVSRSWFDIGFDKIYDVGVYIKPDTLDHFPLTFESFHGMANMQFWNNGYKNPTIDRANTIF